MTTEQQVQSYLDQPKRYYNIDGLGEISVGAMLLGFAFLGMLQVFTGKHSFWNQPWGMVPLLLMFLLLDRGTKYFKRHVTYPRTGFVQYPTGPRAWLFPLLLSFTTSALFGFLLIRRQVNIGAALGILMVPAYAYGFARSVPWKWWIVAAMAAGTVVIIALPSEWTSFAQNLTGPKFPPELLGTWLIEATFFAGAMLVSGAITLARYLQQTHVPDQGGE